MLRFFGCLSRTFRLFACFCRLRRWPPRRIRPTGPWRRLQGRRYLPLFRRPGIGLRGARECRLSGKILRAHIRNRYPYEQAG